MSPSGSRVCLRSGRMGLQHRTHRELIFASHIRLHHLRSFAKALRFLLGRRQVFPSRKNPGRRLSRIWWLDLIEAAGRNQRRRKSRLKTARGILVLQRALGTQMGAPAMFHSQKKGNHKRDQRHTDHLKTRPILRSTRQARLHTRARRLAKNRLTWPSVEQLPDL